MLAALADGTSIAMSCKAKLRKLHLTEADRLYWKKIFSGAEAISRMASNLIDVQRGEQDGLRVTKTASELNALLEETYEMMSPLAVGREQKLELERAPEGAVLSGDRELLRRVLQNPIDNAVRFNGTDAPVRIRAQCLGDAVELRVSDTGPRCPEASRQRVFDKYTRLATSSDLDLSPGHGLGLRFCRIAVEQHRGSIWIEPNQPRGSVFVLRLPLHN